MSGRKQHHIPQSVLRAFEIPRAGRTAKIWVFSREKKFVGAIKDVAAERDFYSAPPSDGTRTLDDLITLYEDRLAAHLMSLRAAQCDEPVEADTAAEVVSHLTFRNAHLRKTFSYGIHLLAAQAIDLFCDETNVRTLLGLDSGDFTPFMRERLDEVLDGEHQIASLNLPRTLLHKVAFMIMKENFSRFVLNDLPSMRLMLELFAHEAPSQMRAGHNQSLLDELAPDARTSVLRSLRWTVQKSPPNGAILPDCVAVGIVKNGAPQPLILSDLEQLTCVLMPLAPDRILVGSRSVEMTPELSDFNTHAASCSHNSFMSNRDGGDLDVLARTIGSRSAETIEQGVATAFEGFKSQRLSKGIVKDNEASGTIAQQNPKDDDAIESANNYGVTFYGISDKATADRIAAVLFAIVRELRPMMSLDRLDGFTFAHDYEEALRSLDRGFTTHHPLVPTNDGHGIGVAMTPIVVRGGIVKSRIVARMEIATALLSEDERVQQQAMHIIICQLAHAACHQMLDESLPSFFLREPSDKYEAFLYPSIDGAWGGYFAARASAIFDPQFGQAYRDLVVSALHRAEADIPAARLQYRFDGDLERLLVVVRSRLTSFLSYLGYVLGHYDGLRQSAFPDSEFEAALERLGLKGWVELFQADLALSWDRRGRWRSPAELMAFTRHVERLFWPFGMFPWKTPEGLIRIEVPIASDAARLMGLGPTLRFRWHQLRKRLLRFFARKGAAA